MMKLVKKLSDLKEKSKLYEKKPVRVKAIQLTQDVKVQTREGELWGYVGDFLIEGIQGEIYPCGKEIFFKTYKEVK